MLPVALSPCPNDTFLFYAWIHGFVGKELPIVPTFADIERLNSSAIKAEFPLIKISCACYKKIEKNYALLPVGTALGYGVGPKVIAKEPFAQWGGKKVLIPGKETTAHALFSYFFPHSQQKLFCTYDQVLEYMTLGKAEVGVIIHETRFTYEQLGFLELADLGALWEGRFALPLPLGALAAHRSLDLKKITTILRKSLDYAYQHQAEALQFATQFAQEKQEVVVKKHIDLYVTEETRNLSALGQRAFDQLLMIL